MADIVVNGNTSGAVTLSAPAVAGTVTVTLPSTTGTMLTTASTTGISGSAISSGTVAEAYGGTGTSTGYYGFKNRIINGAMVIDQRNAGASVNTAGSFAVDRWFMQRGGAAVFSLGQSTTVPAGAGFYNSIVATVTTAAAIGSGDYYDIQQNIEGLNLLDLNWGTANAATVTLSFWVRSSVSGVYSFQFRNSAANRSIVFNYTIATANTWQQITQTIAGDTSGTWLNTNGIGIGLVIPLGTGSSYTTATTGTWQAGNFNASTSALTTWQATLSNTFYITGVQLEKGSTATSFDYRPYGTEFMLCQRYCCVFTSASANDTLPGLGIAYNTTHVISNVPLTVTPRINNPTISYSGNWSVSDGVTGTAVTNIASGGYSINAVSLDFTVASGLTQFRPYYQYTVGTGSKIIASMEL